MMARLAGRSAATLDALQSRIGGCFACRDMDYVHVLSAANGAARAKVMFIGEAPGRLGAARTGVPFTSDQSGQRFQRLLAAAGLRRRELFVTNALLCNPLRQGRNRTPRRREVVSCSRWLEAQLALVRPRLIVTLGAVALSALCAIEPHRYTLARHVGRPLPWRGTTLVALYHPSPRTAARRPFHRQLDDFRRLAALLPIGGFDPLTPPPYDDPGA